MKRIILLVVVNLIVFNGCFAIEASQLKKARHSVYQWIRNYDVYGQLNAKRNARSKYLSLFESGDVIVVNEYLPVLSQKGPTIKISELTDLLLDKESFYKMNYSIDSVYVVEEKLGTNSSVEYVVKLHKIVSFVERNSYEDTCYAYPSKIFVESVKLIYDVLSNTVVATSITSGNLETNIHVLHDSSAKSLDSANRYVSDAFILNSGKTGNPFLFAVVNECSHDPQMVTMTNKAMKWNVHLGAGCGISFYSSQINSKFYDFSRKNGIYYDFNLGFYSQFVMKGKNRFGMDFDVAFSQNKIGISSNYKDSYLDVDEDEMQYRFDKVKPRNYERNVEISNYKETSQRYSVDVPITFRYDRILNAKTTFFVKLGAVVSYDVISKTKAEGDATYYGYYDWMGGITIYDYPKYGFGGPDHFSETTDKSSFDKLSVKIFAGLGVQVVLSKHLSLDLGVFYSNVVYNKLVKPDYFFLTKRNSNYDTVAGRKDEWTSAFSGLSRFNQSIANFKMQLNYNF